jgi:hypothetical protein
VVLCLRESRESNTSWRPWDHSKREAPVSTSAFSALLLVLAITSTSGAQDAPPRIRGPQSSQVRAAAFVGPLRQVFSVDTVERQIRPTHWKEGAVVGGVTTGLGLALLIDGLCSSDSGGNCASAVVLGLVGGGAVGGVVGALIGGQFPKREKR